LASLCFHSPNEAEIQRSKANKGMKDDFFVTVSDASRGEQTILIWVPLAILAHNVVIEHGGSRNVAQKAWSAVIHHGKEIDYEQQLTVRRQVIMAARKAADAVIEELGNGDVAAAVLEAVRVGGEILAKAKATGVVIDAMATQGPEAEPVDGDNTSASSNLICIALTKPMGIVFEPIGDAKECGVRIRELPPGGKAFLSEVLKVGDELLSINDTKMSNMTSYQILDFISDEDDTKQFDLVFNRPNKVEMKAARGRRFRNLIKKSANVKDNQVAEQRDDSDSSHEVDQMSPQTPLPTSTPTPTQAKKSRETSSSFFGLWKSPSSKRSKVPFSPARLIPGWNSSFPSNCTETDRSLHAVMKLLGCADLSAQSSMGSISDYSSWTNSYDEENNDLEGEHE